MFPFGAIAAAMAGVIGKDAALRREKRAREESVKRDLEAFRGSAAWEAWEQEEKQRMENHNQTNSPWWLSGLAPYVQSTASPAFGSLYGYQGLQNQYIPGNSTALQAMQQQAELMQQHAELMQQKTQQLMHGTIGSVLARGKAPTPLKPVPTIELDRTEDAGRQMVLKKAL